MIPLGLLQGLLEDAEPQMTHPDLCKVPDCTSPVQGYLKADLEDGLCFEHRESTRRSMSSK